MPEYIPKGAIIANIINSFLDISIVEFKNIDRLEGIEDNRENAINLYESESCVFNKREPINFIINLTKEERYILINDTFNICIMTISYIMMTII